MNDATLLFHLSDIHFGFTDQSALDWVAQEVRSRRPDAVVITGDLTMRARHAEFTAAREWIMALDVPVTVEVGNHDLPYFNPVERLLTPYKRFRGMEAVVERELDLPGLAIVPLKTTARIQPRLDWSKGWVSASALRKCLAAIDSLPAGRKALVSVHHPLVEVGTKGTALTRGGSAALAELARRDAVLAVLSGHVHDPFDLMYDTADGPVRMVGAGTLSKRIRSTPQSFNELRYESGVLTVDARNRDHLPTADLTIDSIPPDAMPPRHPDDPVSRVGAVPAIDPPVH